MQVLCDIFNYSLDDITFAPDGSHSYQAIVDAGRFKTFKRTQGVSTTDLVGRYDIIPICAIIYVH